MSDVEEREIIRSVFDEPLVTTRKMSGEAQSTGRIKNQLVVNIKRRGKVSLAVFSHPSESPAHATQQSQKFSSKPDVV